MARGRLLRRPRMVLLLASMPSNALDMKSSAPLTGWAAAPTRPWPSPFTKPVADNSLTTCVYMPAKMSLSGKANQLRPLQPWPSLFQGPEESPVIVTYAPECSGDLRQSLLQITVLIPFPAYKLSLPT